MLAIDGAEALDLLTGEHPTPFAFVILDLKLPQLEGKLRELRDPAGHPDDHDEDDNDDDR